MSANLRAALFMAMSMASLTTNDALVKSLGGEIAAGQIILVRGTLILIFLGAYLRAARIAFSLRRIVSVPLAIRTVGEIAGTVLFLYALFHMPIANISAILQALPLAVTLGAALVLKEQVGIRRLSAIAIGFLGVMIIIRPGLEGFSVYSIAVVGTVIFAATRDLATRRIPHAVPTVAVSFVTALATATTGAIMMLFQGGWQPISVNQFLVLLAASIFLFIGYQCIVIAMRGGDIHIVAPFRYTSLVWAIVLGIVLFGEWPDGMTILGSAIIVATGLYTLYRERVVSRRAAAANLSAVFSSARTGDLRRMAATPDSHN